MASNTLVQKSTTSCTSGEASIGEANQSGSSTPKSGPLMAWDNYRLPSHISPVSYDLKLHPDLDTRRFTGEVIIAVQVTQATDYFIVHAKFLNVTESQLRTDRGQVLPLKDGFPYPENEFFVLTLNDLVVPGKYTLHLKFDGSLVNGIVGFYKSEYVTETGIKRSLATSKFEPTYARRAYPCFDEPNFRANFTTTLVHSKDYFALSNMPPLETTTREDGLLETKFQTSVTMPTYLSCFIVCDFKYTETTTKDGKLFRVYSTPNQVDHTKRALSLGNQIQDFYVEYYGIPYPLPKQDLIAIPDFVSGAMEHWGLITFRETNLLFNPLDSSSSNEERIAAVIGHELAHMWFGNLVTMSWWDDLWLNEGFASYMEYLGVSAVEKSWHREEMILLEDLQPVMIKDASINSHPIIQPVKHPDEITEIFDTVTYSKGASVLRMLDSFLGTDDFRTGVKNYLKKYSFGNARTVDLWNELSNASKKKLDIASIMDTWTKQMGFPVIHISRDPERPQLFTARQERFFFMREQAEKVNKSESPFGYMWKVPLTYRQPDNTIETVWMHESEKSFEVQWATNEVVKFNIDQKGFYKVNYEEYMWNDIIRAMMNHHEKFSRADRAHLLDDAFTLSNGGYLNYSVAFNLSKYLVNETDYLPWRAVNNAFLSISSLLDETDIYPYFKKYLLNIYSPIYDKLGWRDDGDHLTRQLRPIILHILCHHGHEQCLQEASKELQSWKNGKHISANLKTVVYSYGISNSKNADDWNFMWKKYLTTVSAQEKVKLLYGLAFTQDPTLLYRYLDYAKDTTNVRSQDFFTVLQYISSNPLGKSIVWDFVREQWEYLVERFTLNDRILGTLIPRTTVKFAREIRLREMLDFFSKFPEAGAGSRGRQQALETVKINIEWLKRYKTDIEQWLKDHVAL